MIPPLYPKKVIYPLISIRNVAKHSLTKIIIKIKYQIHLIVLVAPESMFV